MFPFNVHNTFPILTKKTDNLSISSQSKLVNGLLGLHNFVISNGGIEDSITHSSLDSQIIISNVELIEDDIEVDCVNENWRDDLANQMWVQYQEVLRVRRRNLL